MAENIYDKALEDVIFHDGSNEWQVEFADEDIARAIALNKCAEHIVATEDFAFEATSRFERLQNLISVTLTIPAPAVIANEEIMSTLSEMFTLSDASSIMQKEDAVNLSFQITAKVIPNEKSEQ